MAPVLLAGLTACSEGGGAATVPGTAGPAGIATTGPASNETTSPGTTTAASSPAADGAQWAGSTQFLQVKGALKKNGDDYLQVRPAEKKGQGKSFKTVTLGGAWITVPLSPQAQNVPMKGDPTKAAQFVAALAVRSAGEIGKGFDLTFDSEGRVSKMTWLYLSTREATSATLARWAGSTQFLQIKDAREKDGITYLNVRPAEKRSLGESFETVTIGGPWIEVVLSPLAENVPLRGFGGDAGQLQSQLKDRVGSNLKEGFNITFDSTGQVLRTTWLYVPSGG